MCPTPWDQSVAVTLSLRVDGHLNVDVEEAELDQVWKRLITSTAPV